VTRSVNVSVRMTAAVRTVFVFVAVKSAAAVLKNNKKNMVFP